METIERCLITNMCPYGHDPSTLQREAVAKVVPAVLGLSARLPKARPSICFTCASRHAEGSGRNARWSEPATEVDKPLRLPTQAVACKTEGITLFPLPFPGSLCHRLCYTGVLASGSESHCICMGNASPQIQQARTLLTPVPPSHECWSLCSHRPSDLAVHHTAFQSCFCFLKTWQ